jgi:hypothetical protein
MWVPRARLYSKMKKGGWAYKILEQNGTMWKRDMVGSFFYKRLSKKNHGEMLLVLCTIKRE